MYVYMNKHTYTDTYSLTRSFGISHLAFSLTQKNNQCNLKEGVKAKFYQSLLAVLASYTCRRNSIRSGIICEVSSGSL